MLRSLKEIKGYRLAAIDAEIGRCKDFLFDDRTWTVRHIVVDTGRWLPGRKVLISPPAVEDPIWTSKQISVKLTAEQIKNSPPLAEHEPISRRYEEEYFDYYRWPIYWGHFSTSPVAVPAPGPSAGGDGELALADRADTAEAPAADSRLRSADEVWGYHIHARDGEIGHVEDFIVDDKTWTIRYIVVDTGNWLNGSDVLITPEWTDRVDWTERELYVDMTKDVVESSPGYDPSAPVNREYEQRLYDYYGRPVYW